jgi:hypothetical protein
VLHEKTTIRQDGVTCQECSIVEVAGRSTAVHADVPRSVTPELIYEEYAARDRGGDNSGDKEGGHDLRESVRVPLNSLGANPHGRHIGQPFASVGRRPLRYLPRCDAPTRGLW